MKKIAIAAFAALAFIGSAFAEITLSFSNKLYEEDPIWIKEGDESSTDFPALWEKMSVEIESEKVDAAIEGKFAIDDWDEKHFGLQGEVSDWYIEFRPIEILTLAMHDNIYSQGSYLPIYDDNLSGGNIGSDGFTVVVRPNQFDKALRIALTAPFSFGGEDDTDGINYFNGKKEDGEDENFHIGAGFIFAQEKFEIGATFQNLPCSDDRLIGVSVAFPTLFGVNEGLNVGLGFTNAKGKDAGFDDLVKEDFGVIGENILNLAVTFEKDAFSCAAEVVFDLDDKNDDNSADIYDLYAALNFGYAINEQLGVGLTGKVLTDLNSDTSKIYKTAFEIGVNADYQLDEHNSFGVEFDYFMTTIDNTDDKTDISAIKVPVYWKWSL